MAEEEMQVYLTQWRQAEDRFYSSVMNAPELYTAGIRLVRAIADNIDVEEVDELPAAYEQINIRQVANIAESLGLIHRDFLDYNLARDAAFYLRHREILEDKAKAEMQARIAAAEAQGEAWVTLYNNEHERQEAIFFQRLEMHLPDGLGIYSAIELDWEKGRVYVVEPLPLDPATGQPKREVRPHDPKQEFTTREEMVVAIAALRKKYSADS